MIKSYAILFQRKNSIFFKLVNAYGHLLFRIIRNIDISNKLISIQNQSTLWIKIKSSNIEDISLI